MVHLEDFSRGVLQDDRFVRKRMRQAENREK